MNHTEVAMTIALALPSVYTIDVADTGEGYMKLKPRLPVLRVEQKCDGVEVQRADNLDTAFLRHPTRDTVVWQLSRLLALSPEASSVFAPPQHEGNGFDDIDTTGVG